MIKLKSLYKRIIKYPVSSGLNILSLIIAFTGIITLLLYVSYESSFDKYNKNFHSIYKIEAGQGTGHVPLMGGELPALMAKVIRKNVPGLKDVTPFDFENDWATIPGGKNSFGVRIIYANNSIFNIFTFPFVLGRKNQALTEPNTIVLTQSTANKLFGKQNPIGKKLLLEKQSFTVTGVIQNIPATSSFTADGIVSFKSLSQYPSDESNNWSDYNYSIFCKLSKNTNPKQANRAINRIPELEKRYSKKKTGPLSVFYLKPLADLHFSHGYIDFHTVNKTVLNIFILLAVILALMGIINFVNLSVSQASEKAKAFYIQRIHGASRGIIITQILIESLTISLIALVFAFLVHALLYQSIESLFNIKGLGFVNRISWYFYFVAMAVVYGIIAGSYPAFFISSSQMLQSVKSDSKFLRKGLAVKRGLVVLQFIFSIVFLVVSIGMAKQIHYWKNYNIGIPTKNVIYIPTSSVNIQEHNKAFTREIMKDPNILQYTYAMTIPGFVNMTWSRVVDGQNVSLKCWPVGKNFLNFFNIKIVKGRPFSKTPGADINTFIINQRACQQFGWKNPTKESIGGLGFSSGPVIGVARNFNYSSLENHIHPLMLWLTDKYKYALMLKLKPGHYKEAITHIKQVWKHFEPEHNVYYRFLHDYLNGFYSKEEHVASFINFVSLWTILLSLTGLLGIVIFTTRQKTKEIGIRKVNGAKVTEIIGMLVKEFAKWVAIAFVLAVPIAYYALHRWLQQFAYKTSLSWWIFALAGIAVLIIAMATVSWQTFVAARKNPVEALRYE